MKRPGNQTEDSIDKILTSLRHAEAPAGMEDRILCNLEARRLRRGNVFGLSFPKGIRVFSAPRPQSGLRNALPAWSLKPTTCVAASLALASLVIAVSLLESPREPQTTPIQPQSTATHIASNQTHSPVSVHQESPNYPLARSISGAKAVPAPPSQPLSDEDALALSEMLAPSKPAPPLPLTRQEKMLADVVHRGEPEELASLSPEVRARQMELSQAEFHDFFEPPPAKASE